MAILKGVLEDINLPFLSSRLLATGSAGWLPLNWLTSSALCQAACGCLQKGDKPRSCLSDSLAVWLSASLAAQHQPRERRPCLPG